MMRNFIWIILLIFSIQVKAQYKPSVIVLGGSAAGTTAAIQAAKSGVKTLLIEPSEHLIGNVAPNMEVAAFATGFWNDWKTKYQKQADSIATDPRDVLETMVNNTKDLQFLKGVAVSAITERKGGWEIKVKINDKIEEIKCKILVDATADITESPIVLNKIITLDAAGKFKNLVNYSSNQQQKPYDQLQKLYRTSGATGFGKDSSSLNYIPLGVFIPQEKENLLIVSMAAFRDFKVDDFKNIALWVNMGQAVGALAAYGPFFDTTPAKANIRLTQGEMFTYKSALYPVLDVKTTDLAYYPIQKIIASGILSFDFEKGLFKPNETVKAPSIKTVLAELYPRSRIWFIEHKVVDLSSADMISLFSFINGRDPIAIKQELESDWKAKYRFETAFSENHLITKKEFAVLADIYIEPFNIRVDFNGYFLR